MIKRLKHLVGIHDWQPDPPVPEGIWATKWKCSICGEIKRMELLVNRDMKGIGKIGSLESDDKATLPIQHKITAQQIEKGLTDLALELSAIERDVLYYRMYDPTNPKIEEGMQKLDAIAELMGVNQVVRDLQMNIIKAKLGDFPEIVADANQWEPEGGFNPKEDIELAVLNENPNHREAILNLFDPEGKVWSEEERKRILEDKGYEAKQR